MNILALFVALQHHTEHATTGTYLLKGISIPRALALEPVSPQDSIHIADRKASSVIPRIIDM